MTFYHSPEIEGAIKGKEIYYSNYILIADINCLFSVIMDHSKNYGIQNCLTIKSKVSKSLIEIDCKFRVPIGIKRLEVVIGRANGQETYYSGSSGTYFAHPEGFIRFTRFINSEINSTSHYAIKIHRYNILREFVWFFLDQIFEQHIEKDKE